VKKNILIFIFLFLCSCSVNIKKYSDNSLIINSLEEIGKSNKSNLITYLSKYPAYIEFGFNNQNCIKTKRNYKNEILIPQSAINSPTLVESEIVKGIYHYKVETKFNLNHMTYEQLLMSWYEKMEYILYNSKIDSIKEDKFLRDDILDKFCAYILSPYTFEKLILNESQKKDLLCNYPLNDLNYYKEYYLSLKDSLTSVIGDDFYNKIYENYIERVKRGEMTKEEAEKKYYYLLSEPIQHLYREQRVEILENISSILKFEKFYKKEIKKFRENAVSWKDLKNQFPECLKTNP